MQKYKWAITGSGWISTQMAQALQDTVHEITGIFSIDEEGAKEAADKYGIRTVYPSLESMLADSGADILYIGTPNEVHEQETVAALRAGKHVFCEKPLGLNDRQFSHCLDLAEEKGLVLMDGTTLLHMPLYRKIREVMESGKLGRLKMIQVSYGIQKSFDPKSRFYSLDLGGGALMDIGLYAVSFLCLYLDGTPETIRTCVSRASTGVDDTSAIIVQNDRNQIGTIALSLDCMMPEQAVLCLDKGYILVNGIQREEGVDNGFPRADHAILCYADGRTEEIRCGNAEKALEYEAAEMEEAISQERRPEGLLRAKSVMKILTDIRKEWGIEFPSETGH